MSAPITFIAVTYNSNYVFHSYATNAKRNNSKAVFIFQCLFCKVTETTQTRNGPTGKNSLCNRCGIRWRKEQEQLKKMKMGFILNE